MVGTICFPSFVCCKAEVAAVLYGVIRHVFGGNCSGLMLRRRMASSDRSPFIVAVTVGTGKVITTLVILWWCYCGTSDFGWVLIKVAIQLLHELTNSRWCYQALHQWLDICPADITVRVKMRNANSLCLHILPESTRQI